jgi:tripartite-type tricarboxylate transporter receptor subunit TctC
VVLDLVQPLRTSNGVLARELAVGFQARWKESAVVENRPGGGGIIAYTFVAKAPPDGYTLTLRLGRTSSGISS